METLFNARGRAIIMKDMRSEEDIADGVSPNWWSYRPEYVGEIDPNWNTKAFIEEALAHQDEYHAA